MTRDEKIQVLRGIIADDGRFADAIEWFDELVVSSSASTNSAMDTIDLAKQYAEIRSGEVAYHTMWAFIEWVGNFTHLPDSCVASGRKH